MKLFLLFLSFFSFKILCVFPGLDKLKDTKDIVPYKISDAVSLIRSCKTKEYKLIDPKDYILDKDQAELEKELKDIYKKHKVVSLVIMLDYIDLRDNYGNTLEISNYTNLLIEELYVQNIISIETPIIVAVISIKDKKMTMKVEGRISQIITEQDCYNILNIVNNYFAYGEYSYGSIELGKLINYYLSNTGFWARNKKFFYMIFLLVFCFCFCYFLSVVAQRIKDRRNMRLTMSDEEKLIKIKDFLKKAKANRKILSDSCIICLEPFDNCVSIFHTISQDNRRKEIEKAIEKEKENQRETRNPDNFMETEKDTYMNTYANTNRLAEELNNQEENNINNENSIDIKNNIKNLKNDENSNNNSNNNNANNNMDESIIVQRNSDITDTQISTLPCGHRFHVKCISQWMLQKKNICPMCREKINVDIPENDDEDLQNELLNIQIELHPAFALLVFQTINEELTWGAITLPVINGGLFGGIAGFAFI